MRKALLASAALFGLMATVPAQTQTQTQTTGAPLAAPAGGDTAKPASPSGEPAAGKPTGGGGTPASGASGGTGSAPATAPGGAASGAPTPGGSAQGQAASQPAGNKRAAPGPTAGEGHPHRQATRAVKPRARHVSGKQGAPGCARAAPPSTASPADADASVDRYLRDAQAALRRRCVEEAQDALERAETRALSGSPDADAGQDPTVGAIERAREALGHVRYPRPDLARGGRLVEQAMTDAASRGAGPPPGGQSGPAGSPSGSAGSGT
jgi:hypothetical protein